MLFGQGASHTNEYLESILIKECLTNQCEFPILYAGINDVAFMVIRPITIAVPQSEAGLNRSPLSHRPSVSVHSGI